MLSVAHEIEGHTDNVAASLSGGIVICAATPCTASSRPWGSRRSWSSRLAMCARAQAREALPADVPLADAVGNVASVSKLVLGLVTGDLDLGGLRARRPAAPSRTARHLYPQSAELVRRAPELRRARRDDLGRRPDRAGLGQGRRRPSGVAAVLAQDTRDWAEVLRVPFEPEGAQVLASAGAG